MLSERVLANLYIAIEAVFANKMRSILTALGIIFGVAAVIAMLAIGNGAQQEILEQIKMVGVNNIVVTPIIDAGNGENGEEATGESQKKKFSPGLTLEDVEAIDKVVPTVNQASPEITLNAAISS